MDPHSCKHCKNSYANPQNLARHQERFHPKEEPEEEEEESDEDEEEKESEGSLFDVFCVCPVFSLSMHPLDRYSIQWLPLGAS